MGKRTVLILAAVGAAGAGLAWYAHRQRQQAERAFWDTLTLRNVDLVSIFNPRK